MKVNGLPLLTVLYVALNAGGLFLLRDALAGTSGQPLVEAILRPRVAFGFALYASSFLTFMWALRSHPLTTVFPLFAGAGYAAVAVGGWTLLNEEVTLLKVVGVVLIGVGVVLVQVR